MKKDYIILGLLVFGGILLIEKLKKHREPIIDGKLLSDDEHSPEEINECREVATQVVNKKMMLMKFANQIEMNKAKARMIEDETKKCLNS